MQWSVERWCIFQVSKGCIFLYTESYLTKYFFLNHERHTEVIGEKNREKKYKKGRVRVIIGERKGIEKQKENLREKNKDPKMKQ